MKIKSVNFSQLSDILALTILVDNISNCYKVLVFYIKSTHVPGRFKDYISTPKPNGYQSLHTTLMGPLNQKIEVQVRSFEMNRRAELGVAAHWIYKDNIDVKDGKQFR